LRLSDFDRLSHHDEATRDSNRDFDRGGGCGDGDRCLLGRWRCPGSQLGLSRVTDTADAGRPEPRIKAFVTVAVTDDPEALVARQSESTALYAGLPAYQRVLDLAGLESPADVLIAGSMDVVVAGMTEYVEAGATELRVGVAPSVAVQTKRPSPTGSGSDQTDSDLCRWL